MGPHYDNVTGKYLKDEEVMNAHWLLDDEEQLYLVPREGDSFDTYGADEDKEEILNQLSDFELADEDTMEGHGFTIVHEWQRRFDDDNGYYTA